MCYGMGYHADFPTEHPSETGFRRNVSWRILWLTYEFNTILILSFLCIPQFQISKLLPVSLVTIVAKTMMDSTTLIAKLQSSFENALNTGDLFFFPSTVTIHIDSDIEVIDIVEGLERILQFTDY
jgi:hypothetical protein